MVEGMMQHEMVEETAELMGKGIKQGVKMICYHQQPCRRKCPDDSAAGSKEIFTKYEMNGFPLRNFWELKVSCYINNFEKEGYMITIVKVGRKWLIQGEGSGWIFNKKFPTKWKAEVALEVFKKGGRVSDYWKKQRECAPPSRESSKALALVTKALEEIKNLDPTCEEIEEYGKNAGYGVVTSAKSENYFGPRLHNSWGDKQGGRVHIDIGCCGYHLMLDKNHANDFISFIKGKRKPG